MRVWNRKGGPPGKPSPAGGRGSGPGGLSDRGRSPSPTVTGPVEPLGVGELGFPQERGPWSRRLVLVTLVVTAGVAVLIVAAELLGRTLPSATRAVLWMALILIATWIGVGGAVQWGIRDRARARLLRAPGDWRIRFVLFATGLSLLEEAITTSLTNLSYALGSNPAASHITASTNYLIVIGFSSVVILVPEFVAWAYLLSRIDFRPLEAFLLYGLTGTIGEGTVQLTNVLLSFWFPLYGLFVFLPTYVLPATRPVRTPRAIDYAIAVVLPLLFAIPVGVVDIVLRQHLGIPLLS